jgi:hypothetical protein
MLGWYHWTFGLFLTKHAVDEQHHFASTVRGTFVFSTCPSSAFGEAHVPLLPSASDLQPLQDKPKVLDAWH